MRRWRASMPAGGTKRHAVWNSGAKHVSSAHTLNSLRVSDKLGLPDHQLSRTIRVQAQRLRLRRRWAIRRKEWSYAAFFRPVFCATPANFVPSASARFAAHRFFRARRSRPHRLR